MNRPVVRPRHRVASRGRAVGITGTLAVHAGLVGAMLWIPQAPQRLDAPVYAVHLVAAPRPVENQRRAPEAVQRPAEPPPAIPERPRPQKSTVATPKPPPDEIKREPAPRTAPKEEPAPDAEPSTGRDPGTIEVQGVEFPFPGYLRNIVAQVYRRWSRPSGNEPYRAEVLFFIRRDGSVANFQFTTRSGNLSFDLRAQGAIESAGNSQAFGPLPDGYPNDVLPVVFFFDPATLGRKP